MPLATAITGNGSAYSYKNKYENKYCAGNIWQNQRDTQSTENSSSHISARYCFERVIWGQNACWKMIVWFLLQVFPLTQDWGVYLWDVTLPVWAHCWGILVKYICGVYCVSMTAARLHFNWQRRRSANANLPRFSNRTEKFRPVDKHPLFWIESVLLFHSFDIYLNTSLYQGICKLSLFLGSLFLCWHADTHFLLSLCTQSTNKCTTLTFLSSAKCSFPSDCVYV